MIESYPNRSVDLITSDLHPTFAAREKNIAYRVLKQATDNPNQSHFIAFVGKDRMMNVARELAKLINHPQSFLEYTRPP